MYLITAGTILTVNTAWEEFGRDNGIESATVYVGSNYLDVCRLAAAQQDETAIEALDGLQSVLEGKASEFRTEYPVILPIRKSGGSCCRRHRFPIISARSSRTPI